MFVYKDMKEADRELAEAKNRAEEVDKLMAETLDELRILNNQETEVSAKVKAEFEDILRNANCNL